MHTHTHTHRSGRVCVSAVVPRRVRDAVTTLTCTQKVTLHEFSASATIAKKKIVVSKNVLCACIVYAAVGATGEKERSVRTRYRVCGRDNLLIRAYTFLHDSFSSRVGIAFAYVCVRRSLHTHCVSSGNEKTKQKSIKKIVSRMFENNNSLRTIITQSDRCRWPQTSQALYVHAG